MKFLFAYIFFISFSCFGQNKIADFPAIIYSDYTKEKSDLKEEAPAEVLYRYEKYEISIHQELEIVVFKRIKIYNKTKAEKYLNVEVPLYMGNHDKEKLEMLEAKTNTMENGHVTTSIVEKDTQYKSKITKNYTIVSFPFPNVKNGSIVEFCYKIKSPYIQELPKVYFDEDIPQLYFEYALKSPDNLGYTINFKNPLKESEKEIKKVSYLGGYYNSWKYIHRNVMPYYTEDHIKNINDYRASIGPELNSMNELLRVKFSTSWDQVRRKLLIYNGFGRELDYEDVVRNLLPKDIVVEKNKLTRARKILNFVQSNYAWNGKYGVFVDKGIEGLAKEKSGNVADINLLMTSLMRRAGLKANPLILSTTDNGIIDVNSPTLTQQNYVVTCVEDSGNIYLYDGTTKFSRENILPPRVYNGFGLLVGDDEAKIINLPNTNLSQSIYQLDVDLHGDGLVQGKFQDVENKLNVILLKENYDNNKDQLIKELKNKYNFINNEVNVNFGEDDAHISFDFSSENLTDTLKDKIVFNPLFFLYSKNHDYNQKETRRFPIEFISPNEIVKKVSITIPDGYVFESIPKSKTFKTDDGGIVYSYKIYTEGNKILLESSTLIDDSSFPKEYYPAFKQIFDAITQLEGQLVTIVKK